MNNILTIDNKINKSLFFWLLDFSINKGSLNGNNIDSSIDENIKIFDYLKNKLSDDYAKYINDYLKILDNMKNKHDILTYLSNNEYIFFPVNSYMHYTSCGIIKLTKNTYKIVYINAGDGYQYHPKYEGNILYDNVILEYIIDEYNLNIFLENYSKYKNYDKICLTDFFYAYVLDKIVFIKLDTYKFLIQTTGSCTFTNLYYILIYLLYNYGKYQLDDLIQFNNECKKILANKTYDDIINLISNNNITYLENYWYNIVLILEKIYKINISEYMNIILENENKYVDISNIIIDKPNQIRYATDYQSNQYINDLLGNLEVVFNNITTTITEPNDNDIKNLWESFVKIPNISYLTDNYFNDDTRKYYYFLQPAEDYFINKIIQIENNNGNELDAMRTNFAKVINKLDKLSELTDRGMSKSRDWNIFLYDNPFPAMRYIYLTIGSYLTAINNNYGPNAEINDNILNIIIKLGYSNIIIEEEEIMRSLIRNETCIITNNEYKMAKILDKVLNEIDMKRFINEKKIVKIYSDLINNINISESERKYFVTNYKSIFPAKIEFVLSLAHYELMSIIDNEKTSNIFNNILFIDITQINNIILAEKYMRLLFFDFNECINDDMIEIKWTNMVINNICHTDSNQYLIDILINKINDPKIIEIELYHNILLLCAFYFYKIYENHKNKLQSIIDTYKLNNIIENILLHKQVQKLISKYKKDGYNPRNINIIGLIYCLYIQYDLTIKTNVLDTSNYIHNYKDIKGIIDVEQVSRNIYKYNDTYLYEFSVNYNNVQTTGQTYFVIEQMNVNISDGDKNIILRKSDAILIKKEDINIIDDLKYDFSKLYGKYNTIPYEELKNKNKILYDILISFLTFESNNFIIVNKVNDNYEIILLRYDCSFRYESDNIYVYYKNIKYILLEQNNYNRKMFNCFRIKEQNVNNLYMLIFIPMYKIVKPIMSFTNIHTYNYKLSSNITIIPINHIENNPSRYSELIFADIYALHSYLLSCMYYNNIYYIMNNIEYIYNLYLNNSNILNELNLYPFFTSFDNPLSFMIQYMFELLSKGSTNTIKNIKIYLYKQIYNNIDIKFLTHTREMTTVRLLVKDISAKQSNNIQHMIMNKYYISIMFGTIQYFEIIDPININEKNYIILFANNEINNLSITISQNEEKMINYLNKYELSEQQIKLLLLFMQINGIAYKKNIDISINFYKYLINNKKTNLYPVQELLMGSGKSKFITPLTIILLMTFDRKKNVIICVHESLISQTFFLLYHYVAPIVMKRLIYLISTYEDEFIGLPSKEKTNSLSKLQNFDINGEESGNIILMNDTSFKSLFLKSKIKQENLKNIYLNAYILFDEIDFIANPLTCELNFQSYEKKQIENYKLLVKLADIYFKILSKTSDFWRQIESKYIETTEYINYLITYNDEIENIVSNYIIKHDEIKQIGNGYLIMYINKKVVPFILTHKYNFNYGLPDTYPQYITDELYFFKAIPYIALNTPAYGSEFSDPILNIFITYFAYMYKGITRNIDKKLIIDYIKSNNKITRTQFRQILNDYFDDPNHIITYSKFMFSDLNLINYMKNFPLDIGFININILFEEIIFNSLNKYISECSNISFTELLLSDNLTNFVSFTGTPYVFLPQNDITRLNFPSENIIYDNINTKHGTINANVAICYSINKMKHIYTYENDPLVEIKKIIEKSNYNTLIDVGAFFIYHPISQLVKEIYSAIKNKFRYIIYIDKNAMYYDITYNKTGFLLELPKNNDKDKFFIFDNSHITGIDLKDYMSTDSSALCTLSYYTRLRDASQGIFRLREIFNGNQYSDYIVDDKLKDIILSSTCQNILENCLNDINRITDELQSKLYFWLCKNEHKYNIRQTKQMLKQNILGLYRIDKNMYSTFQDRINTYKIINFIFPYDDVTVKQELNIDEININNIINTDIQYELYNRFKEIKINEKEVHQFQNQNIEQKIKQSMHMSEEQMENENIVNIISDNSLIPIYTLNKYIIETIIEHINSKMIINTPREENRTKKTKYTPGSRSKYTPGSRSIYVPKSKFGGLRYYIFCSNKIKNMLDYANIFIYMFINNKIVYTLVITNCELDFLLKSLIEKRNEGVILNIAKEILYSNPNNLINFDLIDTEFNNLKSFGINVYVENPVKYL